MSLHIPPDRSHHVLTVQFRQGPDMVNVPTPGSGVSGVVLAVLGSDNAQAKTVRCDEVSTTDATFAGAQSGRVLVSGVVVAWVTLEVAIAVFQASESTVCAFPWTPAALIDHISKRRREASGGGQEGTEGTEGSVAGTEIEQ